MMTGISVRDATLDDARLIVELISAMLQDMERQGGDAVAPDSAVQDALSDRIVADLEQTTTKYLIAETDGCECIGLACARATHMDPVFEQRSAVHLSAVYVVPDWRDRGVGSTLVSETMAWARAIGAEFCSLNVLTDSPAKSLYARHGFHEFRVSMRKRL